MDQRCMLFLYEYPTITDDGQLKLSHGLCDNVNVAYPLKKPMYRVNIRNFTSLNDEVEKIDYDFDVDSD
jgi:hypothetical protein